MGSRSQCHSVSSGERGPSVLLPAVGPWSQCYAVGSGVWVPVSLFLQWGLGPTVLIPVGGLDSSVLLPAEGSQSHCPGPCSGVWVLHKYPTACRGIFHCPDPCRGIWMLVSYCLQGVLVPLS
jgi:hypothetical protein